MKGRYFVRYGNAQSKWLEDRKTLVYLRRWTHLYNKASREWFTVTDVPIDPYLLCRPGQTMYELGLKEWLLEVGFWGYIEILEDFVGIRLLSRLIQSFFARKKSGLPLRPPTIGEVEHQKGTSDGHNQE